MSFVKLTEAETGRLSCCSSTSFSACMYTRGRSVRAGSTRVRVVSCRSRTTSGRSADKRRANDQTLSPFASRTTSSTSGLNGNFGQSNYGAAKAGIWGFTRCMAIEGKKSKIRCYALAPVALTRLTSDLGGFQDPKLQEKMNPKLVSPLVVYLASELPGELTDKTFFVGGGRIAEMRMVTAPGVQKADNGGLWSAEEIAARINEILLPA